MGIPVIRVLDHWFLLHTVGLDSAERNTVRIMMMIDPRPGLSTQEQAQMAGDILYSTS